MPALTNEGDAVVPIRRKNAFTVAGQRLGPFSDVLLDLEKVARKTSVLGT